MGRLRSAPGIGAELDRLDTRLKELESRIRNLLARQNGGASTEERPPPKASSELGRDEPS
jgi:hypothetical protein